MIGAPDHGKDIVDKIEDCHNRFLMEKMGMIKAPEADIFYKSICAHPMIEHFNCSFVEKFKRLCECNKRQIGAKGFSNCKKLKVRQS